MKSETRWSQIQRQARRHIELAHQKGAPAVEEVVRRVLARYDEVYRASYQRPLERHLEAYLASLSG
jgi:hypothetical protein